MQCSARITPHDSRPHLKQLVCHLYRLSSHLSRRADAVCVIGPKIEQNTQRSVLPVQNRIWKIYYTAE
jgi:hypothetical protein